MSVLQERVPAGVLPDKISRALKYTFEIDYQHGSTPAQIYLNHPLRVTTILARDVPVLDERTLVTARLHNVLEVSKISSHDLVAMLGGDVARSIEILTVDRAQQHDPIYKNEYYARIESVSKSCARVKVADKLDNIYMLCFNPSENVRDNYLNEIDRWVVPMAERVAPALGLRLQEASAVMRQTGGLDKKKELEQAQRKAR